MYVVDGIKLVLKERQQFPQAKPLLVPAKQVLNTIL